MTIPFFSIVTPVFNGYDFVEDYVYSLASQSFTDWEAIIVDDASSDESLSKLLSCTKYDSRFNLLSSSNFSRLSSFKGPYFPRNIALSVATGKYICFLDIDDYWLHDKLLLQYQQIISNPKASLLISRFYKADSCLASGYLKPVVSFIPIQYQILFWNPVPMLTACVKFSLIKDIWFPPLHHEDFIFWHKVISILPNPKIILICTQPLAIYRSSSTSVSSNKFKVVIWWLLCFKYFGYSRYFSYFLLGVKLAAQYIEYFLVMLRVIHIINLVPIVQRPLSSDD